jgi:hypothetical protein
LPFWEPSFRVRFEIFCRFLDIFWQSESFFLFYSLFCLIFSFFLFVFIFMVILLNRNLNILLNKLQICNIAQLFRPLNPS